MAGYIILGYLFYHNMEVDADGNPWTFIDCMYFAIVTCTSVGYGDLTPKSAGSKMFTCVYALVGIGMIADTLMKVVAIIYRIQKAVTSRATVLMLKHSLKAKAKAQQAMGSSLKVASSAAVQSVSVGKGMTRSITNNAIGARRVSKLSKVGKQGRDVGMSVGKKGLEGAQAVTSAASHLGGAALDTSTRITQSIRNSKTYITLMILVPLIVYIFLALILGHIEGWDWPFVTSIYVACISLTTVGYGDVSPQTQDGRLFAFFYIPTGVAVTLNVIARLAIAYVGHKHNQKVDLATLLALDTSGDGTVSELEFTWYMLKALKKVESPVLDMIHVKWGTIAGDEDKVPVQMFAELDIL
jgi:potassium channel subfamily K